MRRKLILKRIVILIVVVFIGIQFVPITYNKSDTLLESDISNTFEIPSKIQTLLENSCMIVIVTILIIRGTIIFNQ